MKRHFLVAVLGLLICIVVHAVNIGEREGAKMCLEALQYGVDWEVVKRSELHKFAVVPNRWVVERSIFWTMNWRSLCRQYDNDSRTTEAMIYLTSVYYMTKRITKAT